LWRRVSLEQILGVDLHADLHGGLARVVHLGLHDDVGADLDGNQELDAVHGPVTQAAPAWRKPQTAAALSTNWRIWPPKTVPWMLALGG